MDKEIISLVVTMNKEDYETIKKGFPSKAMLYEGCNAIATGTKLPAGLGSLLPKLSQQVTSLAYLYAINISLYGIDVTKTYDTVVEHAYNLERVYQKAYYDAINEMTDNENKRGVKQ